MGLFHEVKLFIVETAGLDKDALHIYVALLIFVLACLVMQWKASSLKPWVVVLIAAIAGEYFDIMRTLNAEWDIIPRSHWHDLWNTMLLPTALVLTARFTTIFANPSQMDAQAEAGDDAAA